MERIKISLRWSFAGGGRDSVILDDPFRDQEPGSSPIYPCPEQSSRGEVLSVVGGVVASKIIGKKVEQVPQGLTFVRAIVSKFPPENETSQSLWHLLATGHLW